ncbi:MAG TPA: lysylphosphatidylglycerol synthase transmembrane domain-containing protein [Acidimicrobiales bacterium]|nr:lysylphosphatidylglycerol synthase transmembrane domain-containing protein [Acidimicrobiales bacterium]
MIVRPALGWIAGLLIVAIIGLTVDWSLAQAGFRQIAANPVPVGAAIVGYALAFVLRAEAWGAVLPVPVSRGGRFRALMAMLAANHALPGPVGEPVRARMVMGPELSFRAALTSVVAARLVDVAAIAVLISGAGLATGSLPGWLRMVTPLALVLPCVALVVVSRRGVRLGPRRAAVAMAWAVPSWSLEAGMVWAVAEAAGVRLTLAEALLVTCGSVLAQVVAVLPGGLGTYEAAATSVLMAVGVAAAPAFTIAAGTHALKFAFAFTCGLPALGWRWPSATADGRIGSTPTATQASA